MYNTYTTRDNIMKKRILKALRETTVILLLVGLVGVGLAYLPTFVIAIINVAIIFAIMYTMQN
jgi:1,4-dihydroxy-2-naphthoate octaprenyltransferase